MQKNIDCSIRQLLSDPQNQSHLNDIGLFLSWYDADEFHNEMWLLLTAAIGSHYFDGELCPVTRENLLFTFGTLLKFTASIATLFGDETDELYNTQTSKKKLPPPNHCAN